MNEAAGDAVDGRSNSGFNYGANFSFDEHGGRFVPSTLEASSVDTSANDPVEESFRASYDAADSFGATRDGLNRRLATAEGSGAAAVEEHSEASSPNGGSPETGSSAPAAPLRKGKWTAEEVAYTTAIIADFSSGCVLICTCIHCISFVELLFRLNLDLWPLTNVIPNCESLHRLKGMCSFSSYWCNLKFYQCKINSFHKYWV